MRETEPLEPLASVMVHHLWKDKLCTESAGQPGRRVIVTASGSDSTENSQQAGNGVAVVDMMRPVLGVLPHRRLGNAQRLIDRRRHVLRRLRIIGGVAAVLVAGADHR